MGDGQQQQQAGQQDGQQQQQGQQQQAAQQQQSGQQQQQTTQQAAGNQAGQQQGQQTNQSGTNGTQVADRIVPDRYALVAPEQSFFDTTILEQLAGEARSLRLTQDEAQSLANHRASTAKQLRDTGLAAVKADAELGGVNFDRTVELVKAGRDSIAPPGSKEAQTLVYLLDVTGYGNHPDIVRMLARLGRSVSEDGGAGGRSGGTPPRKSTAEVLYGKK